MNVRFKLLCCVAACLLAGWIPTGALAEGEPMIVVSPATQPGEAPTTQPEEASSGELLQPTTPSPATNVKPALRRVVGIPDSVKISPEARHELELMRDAYHKLASLELTGTITGHYDVAGDKSDPADSFTSSFQAPNKFTYRRKDAMLVGSTGQMAYAYVKNQGAYVQKEVPKDKQSFRDMPNPMGQILAQENPSLSFALADDAAAQLVTNVKEVRKLDDVKLSGKSYIALALETQGGPAQVLLDPDTHLVRQIVMDQRKSLEIVGQPDVNVAQVTWDYVSSTPDIPVKENQFAWTPPADAQDASSANSDGLTDDQEKALAKKLEGQPAPAFKLPGLDGKDVALADLKGSVVVIDFWATWCPPCIEGLPHLDKIYQENQAAGLKVLAIDEDDDKSKVAPFVQEKKLTIPVLLDNADTDIFGKYSGDTPPLTIVIGKDGKIVKVLVGFTDKTDEKLRKAIKWALKESEAKPTEKTPEPEKK